MSKQLSMASGSIWIGTTDPGLSETDVEQGNYWYTPGTGNLFLCADATGGAQVWLRQTQNFFLRSGSGTVGGGGSVGITYSTAFPAATSSIQLTYTGATPGVTALTYDTVTAAGATVYGDVGKTFSYVAFGT